MAFNLPHIRSEYGFKHNFAPNQGICVFTLGLLCIEYELDTWLTNRDEIIILGLDMQLIGNQNSNYTWVRPTKDVRVLTLELQRISIIYEVGTRLEINNEIRV